MQFELEESGKQSSLRHHWGRASDYLFSTELLEVAEDVESSESGDNLMLRRVLMSLLCYH